MSNVNFNNLRIDEQGRVSFSGLGSGIDYQAAVDSIIRAKRIPVDRIESRIKANTNKITAYGDLKTLYTNFRNTLDILRGKITLGNAGNIFEAKTSFATSQLSGGGLYRPNPLTASAFSQLVGISVDNSADIGSRRLEIIRTAESQRISSAAINSTTDALGYSGTIRINGGAINVTSTMSLRDIRDAINNATYDHDNNPTTDPVSIKVQASLVSASATENYLILTHRETGVEMTFDDPDGILRNLGVLGGNGGVLNGTSFASTNTSLAGLLGQNFNGGNLVINGTTVAINQSDSLQDVRDNINSAGIPNISASISGDNRLVITHSGGGNIYIQDPNGAGAAIGINPLPTNTGNITGSVSIADETAELRRVFSPWAGGSFSVNGEVFNFIANNSLNNIATAINSNATLAAQNVSASVVGGQIIITDSDGHDLVIEDVTNNAATTLGIQTSGGNGGNVAGVTVANGAQSLQLQLSTFVSGNIEINGVSFAITGTMSLEGVRDLINASANPALANVNASIVGGALVLTDSTSAPIDIGDAGGVMAQFGISATAYGGSVTGNSLASASAQLGGGLLPSYSGGTVTINGNQITIARYATLDEIQAQINAIAGISATIVGNALQITNDNPGEELNIDDPQNALRQLGLVGTTGILNELQAAQTALYNLDGLSNPRRFQSDLIYNANATIGELTSGTLASGTFSVTVGGTTLNGIAYNNSMTINDLVNAINVASNASAIGRDIARIESSGARGVRLVIDGDADNVLINNDSNGANGFLTSFNFKNPLLLESTKNTVTSNGMTFTFYQAEPGTIIEVDVEQDLGAVKESIGLFVGGYNALIDYMNKQGQTPENEESLGSTLIGPLFQDPTMRDMKQRIASIMASAVDGADSGLNQLGLLGIQFDRNGMLNIDEEKLNNALLNNPDAVRKFFSFEASSSNANFSVLAFNGDMTRIPGGLQFTFETDASGNLTSVLLNGSAQYVEISGNRITITGGPAKGLMLNYSGGAVAGPTDFNVTYSVGLGARLYEEVGRFTDVNSGRIDQRIAELRDVNKTEQRSADLLMERIERERERLLNQFLRMESALAQFESLKQSLTQSFEALRRKD